MKPPIALIAEDEPHLRGALAETLSSLWPELVICAEVEDGVQALHALELYHPHIVFLDIEMPGLSGIEVAARASGLCHVVFVTAYDEYAITAFEQGAVDYVLKPFTSARIAIVVSRLKKRLESAPAQLDGLLAALAQLKPADKPFLRWIKASQGVNIKLITIEEICYFQADNKYTIVFTVDSKSMIRKPIKELIDELDPSLFVQIHRGTVVNMKAISSVHRVQNGNFHVRLKQRTETLAVSAPYLHHFKQM